MRSRTSIEQNTFYNSIKWYLPSGVNDYQIKLGRKPRTSLLRAGWHGRTTTRNSLEKIQQDKLDHFKLGHHKISPCSNFIYKTLTNIKGGEQIRNTINQDYTYGLKSACHCASACPSRQDGTPPELCDPTDCRGCPGKQPLDRCTSEQGGLVSLMAPVQKRNKKTPSAWLRKWGQMSKTDH